MIDNIKIERLRSGYYKMYQTDDESEKGNYILLFKQELIDLPEIIKKFLETDNNGS